MKVKKEEETTDQDSSILEDFFISEHWDAYRRFLVDSLRKVQVQAIMAEKWEDVLFAKGRDYQIKYEIRFLQDNHKKFMPKEKKKEKKIEHKVKHG